MTAEGHKVASLHGAKDAGERDAIIDALKTYGADHVAGITVGNEYMLKYARIHPPFLARAQLSISSRTAT